ITQPRVYVEMKKARFRFRDPAQRIGIDPRQLKQRIFGKPCVEGDLPPSQDLDVVPVDPLTLVEQADDVAKAPNQLGIDARELGAFPQRPCGLDSRGEALIEVVVEKVPLRLFCADDRLDREPPSHTELDQAGSLDVTESQPILTARPDKP